MVEGQLNRSREGGFPPGKVGEGSQRRVFLEMSNLIRRAVHEINGPEMHVCTTICERGLKTVSVSFDATKFPFQIKCGLPESFVSFAGAKFLSVQEAELDAVRKVADYLTCKFGLRFADWSYEKLHIAERKISQAETSINDTLRNIKSMLGNWKATVGIFIKTQIAFSAAANPLHLAVSEELITLKCEVEACLTHISGNMKSAHAEHAQCFKGSNNNITEDAITIKISERDIIDDILFSLGFKKATFNNTLEDNYMFRGSCKIDVNGTVTSRTTGKTIINSDAKKSAYEAECSTAAKAISFLESVLCIKVVDLNYFSLQEKQDSLNCLLIVKRKYESIEHLVAAEWRSMIIKLKALLNSQYEVCKQLDLDVDENLRIETSEMMEEAVGDISMLYDLSTIDLDQASS